jgi:phytoene dehydrogenase-like protein
MKKIIIIGGGITGLCCGIFLLKKGYSVSIYEKNDFAGGCCSGWYKDGIYIDNCMHWLTGTNQRTKTFNLWKKVGAISETSNLYQGDYFYKSIFEDKSIELSKNIEKLRQDMLALSYIDKKEINKFINTVKSFILLIKETI